MKRFKNTIDFLRRSCYNNNRNRKQPQKQPHKKTKGFDLMKTVYHVVIKKWSAEENQQIRVVAGTFDTYMNASIFAKAYSEHYSTTAEIKEVRA